MGSEAALVFKALKHALYKVKIRGFQFIIPRKSAKNT
jgi:hypothetical protein